METEDTTSDPDTFNAIDDNMENQESEWSSTPSSSLMSSSANSVESSLSNCDSEGSIFKGKKKSIVWKYFHYEEATNKTLFLIGNCKH
jgi:hypothetical protein